MKAKRIVRGVLLAFVFISIYFAIAKEMTVSPVQVPEPPRGDDVVVYYMHASFRCATCNRLEATADKLIRTEFAAQLDDGRLQWMPVNFQEDDELARRYQVSGNMIVVVRFKDGEEVDCRRLADVMDLAADGKWDRIEAQVRQAIGACLAGGPA